MIRRTGNAELGIRGFHRHLSGICRRLPNLVLPTTGRFIFRIPCRSLRPKKVKTLLVADALPSVLVKIHVSHAAAHACMSCCAVAGQVTGIASGPVL